MAAGECPGVVYAELRGESFVLATEEDWERIELYYDQIPRLRAILDFIEERIHRRTT